MDGADLLKKNNINNFNSSVNNNLEPSCMTFENETADRTVNNNDENIIIKSERSKSDDVEQQGLNKEDYIKEVYSNNSDIVNTLFTSFYINDSDYNDKKEKNENNNKINNNIIYMENRKVRTLIYAETGKDSLLNPINIIEKGKAIKSNLLGYE